MDVAERSGGFEPAVKSATRAERAQIWTSMPAVVVSYDPEKQTVTARPTIQAIAPTPDGKGQLVTMPVCPDCPVSFPRGGGFAFTFPISPGDEGTLHFAARCIDAWWQQGGVQPQAELRMHDLSDGMFVPGICSQPRRLSDVAADAMEMRTEDGSTRFILTPGLLTLTGADMHVTGAIRSDQDVFAETVSLRTHVHSGVRAGTDVSGGPVP